MTARHLQIFVEIYRTGSITKAAQNLFLTQPAVTRALHETEAHYGVQLFERMNRRLRVTESGRRFSLRAQFTTKYAARVIFSPDAGFHRRFTPFPP